MCLYGDVNELSLKSAEGATVATSRRVQVDEATFYYCPQCLFSYKGTCLRAVFYQAVIPVRKKAIL